MSRQHDLPLSPGLGTSGNRDPENCAETVKTALELGYRHIDTAQMYGNEAAVGEGLARASVDRDEFTVATKVHQSNLAYDDVLSSIEESRERLGVESIDLLYVHWPIDAYDPADTLPAFDELRESGVIKHIGVSNFTPRYLEDARAELDTPIAAHQIECHPLLPQQELRDIAATWGHTIVGYSPIGRGEILSDSTITEVATTHEVTPAQVCLAWAVAHEIAPIPKTSGDHLEENLAAFDLELSEAALDKLDGIERSYRRIDPENAVWNQS